MSKFDYNPPKLKPGVFKISPSSLNEFLDKTHNWFAVKFEGADLFLYNTGSITGTIVHEILDCYASNRPEPTDIEICEFVISKREHDGYVQNDVMNNYVTMANLGKQWIDQQNFHSAEEYVALELSKNIVIAGTYDGLVIRPDGRYKLIDYKTTAGGLAPKKMEKKHSYQLLCYALILIKQGFDIAEIEAVYISRYKPGVVSEKTGKTGKSYPSILTPISQPVTTDSLNFIESITDLVKDSVDLFLTHPEYANVIWKDQRLKHRNFDSITKEYLPEVEEEF